jgi:hypothetical protein
VAMLERCEKAHLDPHLAQCVSESEVHSIPGYLIYQVVAMGSEYETVRPPRGYLLR